MTPLHQVIDLTRKFLAISAMVVIGIVLLVVGIRIFQSIKESLFPTPPSPPTVSFGKLPAVTFPKNTTSQSITYTVNTVSGSLPSFSDRATVYKINPIQPSLLALKNAENTVASVGFSGSPTAISDTIYSWTNSDSLPKTLTMNVQSQDFTISSNFVNDKTILSSQNLPDQTSAINSVTLFLNNLKAFPADIDNAKTKVSLFAIANGQLTPASSVSTAQIVRVDLFQQDVNTMPIFYDLPSYSSMHMLLGSTSGQDSQIVAGTFSHKSVSSNFATYPIKSTNQALKDLENGSGYIASFTGNSQVTIRNIILGYYVSTIDQAYLMPIYVFEGDNNFFGYVGAVTDEWLSK